MSAARDSDLIRRIEDLERQMAQQRAETADLVAVKNMGRGVLWLLLKIGAVAMTLIALVWVTIAEN